jgi:hypothetical protein
MRLLMPNKSNKESNRERERDGESENEKGEMRMNFLCRKAYDQALTFSPCRVVERCVIVDIKNVKLAAHTFQRAHFLEAENKTPTPQSSNRKKNPQKNLFASFEYFFGCACPQEEMAKGETFRVCVVS